MPTALGYLMVKESGASGGYAFVCSHPQTGTWFFKRPNASDAWGIRFSAGSSALLVNGLEGLRQRIANFCEGLGIIVAPDDYRISRVDFAVDFLAPDFEPDPENFVIHSHTSKKTIAEFEGITTNDRSSRITSITVGKMPGRQVILYDKRAEVMVRGKAEWPLVWSRALHGPEAGPLDLSDRAASQVWRIELRAGKRHLKDGWFIEGWPSFYQQTPKMFAKLLQDVRYCTPSEDTNRARWPTHAKWRSVEKIVEGGVFAHVPKLSAEEYREIKASQKRDELLAQSFGLLVSAAAIDKVEESRLPEFTERAVAELIETTKTTKRPLSVRLAEASARFAHLVD